METNYKVKIEIFEGPLVLLLYLIKRDENDTYYNSIDQFTYLYHEYLQAFKELNNDIAEQYVVITTNHLYLKSHRLLPLDQQPAKQYGDEDDPRCDLIGQLNEYKK